MRWLTCRTDDVPAGDGWLTPRERAVASGLHVPPRQASWRLGRWTAKALCGAGSEILAAGDGAPQLVGSPGSLSLSHRADRALAVVDAERVVGCDLELVEPRSSGFVEDWLDPLERAELEELEGDALALAVMLRWSAKEAAAKLRREGMRLDLRDAVVVVAPGRGEAWAPLAVRWGALGTIHGWWRRENEFVMTVVSDPAGPPPERAPAQTLWTGVRPVGGGE